MTNWTKTVSPFADFLPEYQGFHFERPIRDGSVNKITVSSLDEAAAFDAFIEKYFTEVTDDNVEKVLAVVAAWGAASSFHSGAK